MGFKQRLAAIPVLILALALAGCGPAATPAPAAAVTAPIVSTRVESMAPTATMAVSPTATVEPTVTLRVVDSLAASTPAATLVRNSPSGKCRWDVYMQLSGFAPNNVITVVSNFDEVECATGKVTKGGSWTEVYGTRTDANGRLMIAYLHEGTGSYLYTFSDEHGNRVSLPLTTEPGPTQTPRVTSSSPPVAAAPASATPRSAVPTKAATAEREPLVVVQSATLNLRSGPGQVYSVVGRVERGDKLYPAARVGECAWLQVGVLGQSDLVWVAGGPQYVTLNVPCETLRVQDSLPPTPQPAPTAVPRPATGLLSRAGGSGPGRLVIKNGTDRDGVVILVTAAGDPAQAAYIRAAESFEMTQIADGSYRLYFAKGEGWDPAAKAFTRNVTRQRFEDMLDFGGTVAGYEVTLYGVAGGTAATEGVPAGQFPAVP